MIPRSGRSPGEGNGYPLQYSCLENAMDRRAWWVIVHGITKSWTQLSDFHFIPYQTYIYIYNYSHVGANMNVIQAGFIILFHYYSFVSSSFIIKHFEGPPRSVFWTLHFLCLVAPLALCMRKCCHFGLS